MGKNLSADTVVARVHGAETNALGIGFDAATWLGHVDDDTGASLGDSGKAGGEGVARPKGFATEEVA
ncbi:MAG: hypothetical protein RL309_624 [Verrucomicrobiota bacterium]